MNRGKFDGIESYPLFDEPPRVDRGQRNKAAKVAGWAHCPHCSNGRVALLVAGEHLVYREHTYVTYSGAKLTCRASAVALCTAPPRPDGVTPWSRSCPHGGTR